MADNRDSQDWRKMAETHKMSPEDVKAAGVEASRRLPGKSPGGVLHQRRELPYSFKTMAVAGLLIARAVGYVTLYLLKKPEASAGDVAKVATRTAKPEDTHPRSSRK